jgi:HAD superfamily hydrolase (TIGR01509 family)
MNILVTCGGGFQGLTLYKEISLYPHVKSYLIDIHKENISKYFFDYFSICPPVNNKNEYLNFIFNYCKEYKINYVFPATNFDLEILSEIKNEFAEQLNCYIAVPDTKYIMIFRDKLLTHNFLEQNKINVQKLLDPFNENNYPIIGKYKKGWGGKDIHVFYSIEDFKKFTQSENYNDYIWVKYLKEFKEYSIDFSINFKFNPSDIIIRERKSVSGGFAVVTEQIINPPEIVENIGKDIVDVFIKNKIVGAFNIQILYVDKNTTYCSDLNPRIGTSAIIHKIGKNGLIGNFIFQDEKTPEKSNVLNNFNTKAIRYLDETYIKKINHDIKGIVFDLDDTLISNKEFIIERCKLLYDQQSELFGEYSSYILNVLMLLNEGYAPFLIDKICEIYGIHHKKNEILSIYRKCFPNKIKFYPDVEPTLEILKKNNFKLFILTDNPVNTQKHKWNIFPFKDLFDDIIFTNEHNLNKPNHKCFNLISKTHNIKPENLIMVGDNQVRDILGAIQAGYFCAFQIHRDDGLISNYPLNNLSIDNSNIFQIKSLKEIPFYLIEN